MKDNKYWRKRFLYNQIFNAKRMDRVSEEYAELLQDLIKELSKEITYWYLQFAKDGELTSLKSRQMLNQSQLKEIKTDVYDFIKKAKENGISGEYTKELDYIYNRVKLNRLELLRSVIDMGLIELYHSIDESLKNELEQTYIEAQGRTVYEISKGNGKLVEWSLPTKEMIDVVLLDPWASDGRNFSDNIWTNKARLLNALETELRKGFVMGKSVNDITKAMSSKIYNPKQRTATAEYQIRRIVHTEIGHFAEEAKTKVLQGLDVEKYEIDATLDSNTCSVCSSKDKEVYSYNDRIEGVNAPVFHPFCRCTTAPYFPDDFEDSMRFARDKDGKPIYVPNSMKYSEYYDKYLKDSNNSDIIKNNKSTLTDDERLYVNKYISSDCYILNGKLRNNSELDKYDKEFIKNLDSALSKLSNYEGTVYRTADFSDRHLKRFISQHTVGAKITYPAYTSSSTEKDYNDLANVFITIKNSTKGKDMREYNKPESEVLFERNSQFEVVDVKEENGKYKIELREI